MWAGGGQAIVGVGLDCSKAELLALRGPGGRAVRPPTLLPNVFPSWGNSLKSPDQWGLRTHNSQILGPQEPLWHKKGHWGREGICSDQWKRATRR